MADSENVGTFQNLNSNGLIGENFSFLGVQEKPIEFESDCKNCALFSDQIIELKLRLLESRDYSIGLAAETGELRAMKAEYEASSEELELIYKSRAWRIAKKIQGVKRNIESLRSLLRL